MEPKSTRAVSHYCNVLNCVSGWSYVLPIDAKCWLDYCGSSLQACLLFHTVCIEPLLGT